MNYQKTNKQNLPNWNKALKFLTSTLDQNNILYYLSASGLEYIQGSNKYPYDIDLFISKDNIQKAYELLEKHTTSKIHLWKNRFLEFQGKYQRVPFEICEWEKQPTQFENIKYNNSFIKNT